ncbi:hypothetical protein N9U64_01695 [Pseudomonadota bacterium]|jgi:hypothetical protein|nr:hypothetical protein [Pseudomonadota bacterium]MDA9661714.1 hypothetical protein [Pseudomonadota bacterium]MDA9690573.1 hypothetical protein [Pseudomonadota bacterium]
MALSKKLKNLIVLLTILFSSGCQHEFVNTKIIQLTSIKFNSSISNSFKERSKKYFAVSEITNLMQDSSVTIQKIEFKKRNFYGGSNVRPKEIEILGELHYQFNLPDKQKAGMISAIVQMPSNEINPQAEISAQKQLQDELEFILLDKLSQEYWLVES